MKPLILALHLAWLNNGQHQNHIGDHGTAESWAKYLRRRDDVARVDIVGQGQALPGDADVCIAFHPWLPAHPTAKNVLYLQSGLPREMFPGGTVGVFEANKERFDGYCFTSKKLRDVCGVSGAVLPFAADPEVMSYQPHDAYAHPVCFVGNDIRGDMANDRYLAPAIPHGLVIYGGPWRQPQFQAVHRGRLIAEDLPKVYSSSRVNLNVTIPIHAEYGTVNARVYEVLACGGCCLSDWHEGMEAFRGFCEFTNGGQDTEAGVRILSKAFRDDRDRDARRAFILANHTFAHRMADLMRYLKEML